MMGALGRQRAKVIVCQDPRFRGTGQALKWEFIEQALDRHQGMVDLFLLCVDRDGNEHRRKALDKFESDAKAAPKPHQGFFAENAWQEIEVWLLAGHDLPKKW